MWQFYGHAFKIALWDQWLVVVSGPKMADELRRRPDHEVSFIEGAEEVCEPSIMISVLVSMCPQIVQTKYTIGSDHEETPHVVDIVRDKLTRALPTIFPEVVDELSSAFADHIPAKNDGMIGLSSVVAQRLICF